jgi:hypothetical protein
MDDIQRPNLLVAEIAREKHLYARWHGNRCHIEKVLNFPETSMSIHVKSVVYSSSTGPMKRLFEDTKHYPEDGINVFQRPERNYPIQG